MQPSHRTADLAGGAARLGRRAARRRLRVRRAARGRRAAVLRLGRPDRGARAARRRALGGRGRACPSRRRSTAFWSGAARARHAERTLGRLVPGAAADLVVLDRDPTSCPVEELDRIEVVATMVGGPLGARSPPMVKIVVTRALPEIALERLRAHGEVWASTYPRPLTVQELHEAAAGASALVTMPSDRVDAALLAATGPAAEGRRELRRRATTTSTSRRAAPRASPRRTRPTRSSRRPPTWPSR